MWSNGNAIFNSGFAGYLQRMKIIESSRCSLCGSDYKNAQHLLIWCSGTKDIRRAYNITPDESGHLKITNQNSKNFLKTCTNIMERLKASRPRKTTAKQISRKRKAPFQPCITAYFKVHRTS